MFAILTLHAMRSWPFYVDIAVTEEFLLTGEVRWEALGVCCLLIGADLDKRNEKTSFDGFPVEVLR